MDEWFVLLKAETELTQLRNDSRHFESTLATKTQSIRDLETEIARHTTANQELKSQLELTHTTLSNQLTEVTTLQSRITQSDAELQRLAQALERSERARTEYERTMEAQREQLRQVANLVSVIHSLSGATGTGTSLINGPPPGIAGTAAQQQMLQSAWNAAGATTTATPVRTAVSATPQVSISTVQRTASTLTTSSSSSAALSNAGNRTGANGIATALPFGTPQQPIKSAFQPPPNTAIRSTPLFSNTTSQYSNNNVPAFGNSAGGGVSSVADDSLSSSAVSSAMVSPAQSQPTSPLLETVIGAAPR
jgi:hypothetical protein